MTKLGYVQRGGAPTAADRILGTRLGAGATAFLDEGRSTEAGRILAELGLEKNAFLDALASVRGTQRVTTDSPESTYDALSKYGMDLVEMARSGKLDPVIGREHDDHLPRDRRLR